MRYTDDRFHLRIELEAKNCTIAPDERTRMQTLLEPLGNAVVEFTSSTLQITVIHHPRSAAWHVEFKLKLPGHTLFAGAHDTYLDSAFQQSVSRMTQAVADYKANPDYDANELNRRREALNREVVAPEDPKEGPIAQAVREGDYRAFRTALARYEEWLRNRVGRWIQRYPETDVRVGRDVLIGDVVEEVYLNAFEEFTGRPTEVPLSNWLEGLIDPSLRALLRFPEMEKQNASLARTVRESTL